jgi:site-specific recombinase XerC
VLRIWCAEELLGHGRLDTTQLHTAVSIAQLREVQARCHARGLTNSGIEESADLPLRLKTAL